MRPPEPLGPQHQLEGFDCGNVALNRWLQQRALSNERQGLSRTVVLCSGAGSCVITYACLSAGAAGAADRSRGGRAAGSDRPAGDSCKPSANLKPRCAGPADDGET